MPPATPATPPADAGPIPVTLLTGFLGSGKTTLLNRLLRRLPLTAVVINEFGEIGLDHQLLEETRGPLALLAGGCVCCQVQGALAPTLKNLYMGRAEGRLPAYQRVIIETTGVADPAPILGALLADRWIAARHRLDGIVTTVDALFGAGQLDDHPEAARQVAVADRLLLTKTDLATPATIAALRARLADLNPAAPVLEVIDGDVDADRITGIGLADGDRRDAESWLAWRRYRPAAAAPAAMAPRAGHDHGERIRAFSLRFEQPLDWFGLLSALDMLRAVRPRNLLRMKGIVHVRDRAGPVALHAVQHLLYPPVELPDWPDQDRSSRLVFITADLDPDFVARLLDDFTRAAAGG